MIKLENVTKIYLRPDREIHALDNVIFSVERREFVVVRGPSGSGKSTLLLTIAGLLKPTRGKVVVDGRDLYAISNRERALFRAEKVGFVFQMFHLLPYLDVLENVLIPSISAPANAGRNEAIELLARLQLSDRLHHRPADLSAGERQRVALARALLNQPSLILADEPTGNLDPDNAAQVLAHLADFHKSGGTVVLVSHDKSADQYAQRIFLLDHGRIRPSQEKR